MIFKILKEHRLRPPENANNGMKIKIGCSRKELAFNSFNAIYIELTSVLLHCQTAIIPFSTLKHIWESLDLTLSTGLSELLPVLYNEVGRIFITLFFIR